MLVVWLVLLIGDKDAVITIRRTVRPTRGLRVLDWMILGCAELGVDFGAVEAWRNLDLWQVTEGL